MPPVIIGGAIAAAGAVGGAVVASNGAKSAANATERSAERQAALQDKIHGENVQTLAPYVATGIPATSTINALLGIGTDSPDYNAYLSANPDVMQGYYQTADKSQFSSPEEYAQWHYQNYGSGEHRGLPTNGTTANQAFDTYRKSTGYDFRLNQGIDAVKSGFAGSGMLQSGATMKALNDYGQGMASSEFGNYLGALGNQQGLGLSAASAQAGVGQNYANSLGNIYQAQGNNLANAALVKSQNTAGALNSLAGIGGNILGQQSYKPSMPVPSGIAGPMPGGIYGGVNVTRGGSFY
jgi:hypothetical protein